MVGCRKSRARYHEWMPRHCTLQPFARDAVCTLLRGRGMLFVGDSTVRDVFQSFVMLLGGRFGRQHFGKDVTASACDDELRLNYVRNDLVLYSSDRQDQQMVYACSPSVITQCFVRRAASADIVILGVGQHFSSTFSHVQKWTGRRPPPGQSAADFFVRSFNHTIASIAASRTATARGAIVVLGASMPVPGCSRFESPISLDAAMAAYAHPDAQHSYASLWEQNHLFNQAARWLAQAHGVGFVDVAAPSLQRPDATRGLADTLSGRGVEDCASAPLAPSKLRAVPYSDAAWPYSRRLHAASPLAPFTLPSLIPRVPAL